MDHQQFLTDPLAIFPLGKNEGIKEALHDEIEGTEMNLAFDDIWTPLQIMGSPVFDAYMQHNSFILWETKDKIELHNEMTIMMWMKPTELNGNTMIMV